MELSVETEAFCVPYTTNRSLLLPEKILKMLSEFFESMYQGVHKPRVDHKVKYRKPGKSTHSGKLKLCVYWYRGFDHWNTGMAR